MKTVKRSLSLILALALCLTLCVGVWASGEAEPADAAEEIDTYGSISEEVEWDGPEPDAPALDGAVIESGTCGESASWTLTDDGTLTISGTGEIKGVSWYEMDVRNAVIESGVTSIGDEAFYGCSSLESVVIPEGVTSIGRHAFTDCSSLTSVVIPGGVTSISEGAFADCSSLTSVTIPETVTYIGEDAFRDCSSLTDIFYNGEEADWAKIEIGPGLDESLVRFIGGTHTLPGDADGDGDVTASDAAVYLQRKDSASEAIEVLRQLVGLTG